MERRFLHMIPVLALLALAVGPGPVRAQPANFRVEGNRALSDNEVIRILRTAGWSPGRGPAGLVALQEAYYREGYFLATVSVGREPLDTTTVVVVDEGEVARIASVRVHGAEAISEEEVITTLRVAPGEEFRPREFTDRVDRLLRRYDAGGYPFVQLWIDSLGHNVIANQVDLGLTLVEGTPRTISTVEVSGLQRTRSDLAVRISGIDSGSSYRRAVLDDAYLRLLSSRLFDEVKYPTVRVSADGRGVDVVLKVVEPRRANLFNGAVGYAAAEAPDQERVLSGLVDLRLRNIGGSLKDFEAFWSNDGVQRSDTRLTYRDRFFLGRQLTVGLRLEQIGQDTLYTWQSLGLETEKPVGHAGNTLFNVTVGLFGDRNVFSTGNLVRSWRYRTAAGTKILRGNRRYTNFFSLDARFTWAYKQNTYRDPDSTGTVDQYILEALGESTKSFARLLHGRLKGMYRGLRSDEDLVPLSEQFYIGGARTLRGYRENQFHGRRVGTLSGELLVGPGRWENGYIFVDGGYVYQETPQPDGTILRDNIFPVGFGFGLRTGSPVGNIDLSFAVDEHLSLSQTKVHVLLEQNF